MKHCEYFNTIWSHRDQEFFWEGIKFGIPVGIAISAAAVCVVDDVCRLIKFAKTFHKSKKDGA